MGWQTDSLMSHGIGMVEALLYHSAKRPKEARVRFDIKDSVGNTVFGLLRDRASAVDGQLDIFRNPVYTKRTSWEVNCMARDIKKLKRAIHFWRLLAWLAECYSYIPSEESSLEITATIAYEKKLERFPQESNHEIADDWEWHAQTDNTV